MRYIIHNAQRSHGHRHGYGIMRNSSHCPVKFIFSKFKVVMYHNIVRKIVRKTQIIINSIL